MVAVMHQEPSSGQMAIRPQEDEWVYYSYKFGSRGLLREPGREPQPAVPSDPRMEGTEELASVA